MSTLQPTVAIGDSFLRSMTDLPDKIMKKVREMITKFQHNPTSPGLNYETIQNARDHRMRSIRVDQAYRCIVLKSDQGDTYILLWVDKHDEAYAWAASKTCGVNPNTGSIQIVEVFEKAAETEVPAPAVKSKTPPVDMFAAFSDADLKTLGATPEMIPSIRSIPDGTALEAAQPGFPSQLYEALFMLACGENFASVLDELGIETGKTYDPDDFKAALELDSNQQHFKAISSDTELEAILNEPLAFWRVYLHPSQRKLVTANFNGPARVLGGAGTGKTVVAMHRAQFLASQCGDHERILFTTFTKSLIHDIKKNLQKICSYDEIRKIEVLHLDAWCHNFLRAKNYRHQIVYGGDNPLQKKLWETACDHLDGGQFSKDFLRDEWEKAIQYHDIETFADYAGTARAGRAGRLSRADRKAIWPVFQEYRTLLNENQLWEPADMFRAARTLLIAHQQTAGFKHIIVDEIQDFHPQAFRLLRAMIPVDQFPKNDLFLVGDGHQNIYGHHIALGQLGINIRGRGRKLKLNYRTPEQTRRWASSLLDDALINDLDGNADTSRGYRSILSGPEPRIETSTSFEAEIKIIVKWFQDLKKTNPNHVACVVVRTNDKRETYAKALTKQGCEVQELTAEHQDIDDPKPLRISTMHRVKGLEFDHICMASCNPENAVNWDHCRKMADQCLLHVAATRTKNSLLVTNRK